MATLPFVFNPFEITARRTGAQDRAKTKRDGMWPHAASVVWDRKKHKGFTSIPRTLPHVMLAMDSLCKNAPPSAPYLVLWARAFEEHFLTIENPAVMAAESGYSGQRAVTTWNGRMKSLVELGFIEAKRGPTGDYQYVLMRNPNLVMEKLERDGRFTNESQRMLYEQFRHRHLDIGGKDFEPAPVEPEKGEGQGAPTPSPSGATSGPGGPATLTPPLSGEGKT
jgi:hypothetical protein